MYPITCAGGYPLPMKAGKFEIFGFRASINTAGTAARVTLVDDETIDDYAKVGTVHADSTTLKTTIIDVRDPLGTTGNLEVMFPEPIKTRHGISISGWDNIVVGTGMLYVR